MTDLLTSAQMRAIERAAIDSGHVTGLELMERAGRGVVTAILAHWPDMQARPHRAVILCGPGNNGGDGFVVACELARRGWSVDVFFYGLRARLPPDAAQMHDRWQALGAINALSFLQPTKTELRRFKDRASSMPEMLGQPAQEDGPPQPPFLLVDALFGIGLSRPLVALEEILLQVDHLYCFRCLNNCRIVSIDVPSGLDADKGAFVIDENSFSLGGVCSDLTVTFHAPKQGHLSGIGPRVCGALKVVDIGLGPWEGQRHGV